MVDIANNVNWRDLLVIDLATVVLLVVVGVVKGGPLLTDTALAALPVAFAATALALALIKRRWGTSSPPG